jgi:hypothetical protein
MENRKFENRKPKTENRIPSHWARALDLYFYDLPAEAHPGAPIALSILDSTFHCMPKGVYAVELAGDRLHSDCKKYARESAGC